MLRVPLRLVCVGLYLRAIWVRSALTVRGESRGVEADGWAGLLKCGRQKEFGHIVMQIPSFYLED